jgi:hypothetical protein
VSTPGQAPRRTVIHGDALAWLEGDHDFTGCAFVTSLPDVSELSLPLPDWQAWFVRATRSVMRRCPPESVAIFFQTDVKKEGAWIDKGALCQQAATAEGLCLLFHKIVCRKPAGTVTFGRPAYSHLMCWSKSLRVDLSRSSPDVLPDAGPSAWTRGMGTLACRLACRFVIEQTKCRTVVDPFCGKGTVLAAANAMGLDAIGVELCRKRAKAAQALEIETLERGAVDETPD